MPQQIEPDKKVLFLTIGALVVFALLSVSLRTVTRLDDRLPTGDSAWVLNLALRMQAEEKGTLSISPPWDTRHARLYSQTLTHPGMRQRRTKTDAKDRDIVLAAPKAGSYQVESRFSIYVSHLPLSDPKRPVLSETNRAAWLSSSEGVSVNTDATEKIINRLAKDSPEPDRLVELLFNYVSNKIRIDHKASSDSEAALKKGRANALGSTRALLALLRTAHLPARAVVGVDLQTPSLLPVYWAEVYSGDTWVPLDPVHGYLKELPIFYIPVRKGDDLLVKTENAAVVSAEWRIESLPAYKGVLSSDTRDMTDIFDLNRLSPDSREILSALLLLPLGVLATELIRQIAGVRTYGVFTPTLLALAMTHVYWVTAIIVLMLVTIIGVAIRAAMPELNLQRTPRLAIVFTLVAMSMTIVVSGVSYFEPGVDNAVTLLPLVILTMLVDRIYTVYDERGMKTATVRLFWTVIAAIASLLVLLQEHWGTWLVSYPEMHAVTLAAIVIIGLYDGKRLKDLPQFAWLKEPTRTQRSRRTDKRQSEQSGDSV